MSLPVLANWNITAHSLHQAAELLGAVRRFVLPHVPNWLELALKVIPEGVSTDKLPTGGEVVLDFGQAAFVYRGRNGGTTTIPLADHSQQTLFRSLLVALQADDFADLLAGVPESELPAAVLQKRPPFAGDTPLLVDVEQAGAYADVLYTMFTGIARFRARLLGHVTPVVVWPEHFDLSTLWFVDGAMDDHQAHLNFGFAPFSPGFPRPYLYAYAYPYPPGVMYPDLPAPAYWNFEGWTGVVVNYDDIARADDAAQYVEDLSLLIFATLRPLLPPA